MKAGFIAVFDTIPDYIERLFLQGLWDGKQRSSWNFREVSPESFEIHSLQINEHRLYTIVLSDFAFVCEFHGTQEHKTRPW